MRVFAPRMADGETSPKAFLAFIFPAIMTLILVLLEQWLGPDWDPTLKLAILGVVDALAAFAGAWLGKPGYVDANPSVVSASPNR
jgi:hypothetical protein